MSGSTERENVLLFNTRIRIKAPTLFFIQALFSTSIRAFVYYIKNPSFVMAMLMNSIDMSLTTLQNILHSREILIAITVQLNLAIGFTNFTYVCVAVGRFVVITCHLNRA